MAWMSRTLLSTSVKSPKSLASASAASTAFWACCSKRTKNWLFLGMSDRRTAASFAGHILPLLLFRRDGQTLEARWPPRSTRGARGRRSARALGRRARTYAGSHPGTHGAIHPRGAAGGRGNGCAVRPGRRLLRSPARRSFPAVGTHGAPREPL